MRLPLVNPIGKNRYAHVIKTEEKGSDVNLATHLLNDAYQDKYDVGVVVSNDSDLLEPIKIVRKTLKKKIGILNPYRYPSKVLLPVADFYKPIRKGVLNKSLFSDVLEDDKGTCHKPD
ncbi:MAG: NYN domain-containing protein [Fidelibacterota bacterium]